MTPPFPGDWRPAAPTLAQVRAHGGRWWSWRAPSPPRVGSLRCQRSGDRERVVWLDDQSDGAPLMSWNRGSRAKWRGGALVCPCDADGAPVAWP